MPHRPKPRHALVNFYRNGNDAIGWHSDKDAVDGDILSFTLMGEQAFVKLKSGEKLVQTRTFNIRWLTSSDNSDVAIVMEQGSAIHMLPGMNRVTKHSVKKVTKKEAAARGAKNAAAYAGRINVTFRWH